LTPSVRKREAETYHYVGGADRGARGKAESAMHERVVVGASGRGESSAVDPDAAVAQAAQTEPHAFGVLYRRHVDSVYRYLYRQTGTREAAEDLTSLTFMRALAGLPRFQTGRPFKPWLVRIAHNALIDYRRAAARTTPLTARSLGALEEQSDPGSASTLEAAEAFLEVTTGLPPLQRDALALRYIADLTVEQTATALGRSVAATGMLISRGLGALRARRAAAMEEKDR